MMSVRQVDVGVIVCISLGVIRNIKIILQFLKQEINVGIGYILMEEIFREVSQGIVGSCQYCQVEGVRDRGRERRYGEVGIIVCFYGWS